MKTESYREIKLLCIGALIGKVMVITNQHKVPSINWLESIIIFIVPCIAIPFFIFCIVAFPYPKNMKYYFGKYYFNIASRLLIGIGFIFFPVFLLNGSNLATSLFAFLFGLGVLFGTIITDKYIVNYND